MRETASCLLLLSILLWFSSAAGQTDFWQQTNGPGGGVINVLTKTINNDILAGTSSGVYRLTNGGMIWENVSTGLTNFYVQSISATPRGMIFTGTLDGIFRSSDNGETWTLAISGLTNTDVPCLTADSSGGILAGTARGGVFRSSDEGDTWAPIGLSTLFVWSLAVDSGAHLYAGTSGGVFKSTDNGATWLLSLDTDVGINDIAFGSSTQVFAAGSLSDFPSVDGLVWRSTDHGGSWTLIEEGLQGNYAHSLAVTENGDILVGISREFPSLDGGGVYLSTDDGETWLPTTLARTDVRSLLADSFGVIFAGTNGGGILQTTDNGTTWTHTIEGMLASDVRSLAVDSNGTICAGLWGGGVSKTSDGGTTWETVGLMNKYVDALAVSSVGYVFAGLYGDSLHRSTDEGLTWSTIGTYSEMSTRALAFSTEGILYAATNDGVSASTNDGLTWSHADVGDLWSLIVDKDNNVFAGSFLDGVFRSTDNGTTWTNLGLTGEWILALATNFNGYLFAGTTPYFGSGGIFRSTNSGTSWTQVLPNVSAADIVVNPDGEIFAATPLGVYYSDDSGSTWSGISDGLMNADAASLTVDHTGFVYVGTHGHAVFRSIDATTSVNESVEKHPIAFSLHQNYPNPFNATTTLSFSLPASLASADAFGEAGPAGGRSSVFANLSIYDILGRRVATLANEKLGPGTYTRQWNAQGLPSGVYFYRLQAGRFLETKKLVLLR